jgi:serine/threonine protein kinase
LSLLFAHLLTVFLTKDKKILKIGDFGMARTLGEDEWAHSMCGVSDFRSNEFTIFASDQALLLLQTVDYMAPEILADTTVDRNYDETVDLHAIGVVLYRMCSLE